MESLTPTPTKPRSAKERVKSEKEAEASEEVDHGSGSSNGEVDPAYGSNPVGVLIAACTLCGYFSRSVNILRTTLQDVGVGMPLFELLQHPNIEVQIAATCGVCNLVLGLSPMKEVSWRQQAPEEAAYDMTDKAV